MDRELYQFLRNRIVQRLQRTNPEKAIDIAYVHNKVLTLIEEGEECICQGLSAEEIKQRLHELAYGDLGLSPILLLAQVIRLHFPKEFEPDAQLYASTYYNHPEIKPYLDRIIEMFRGKDLRKGVECPEEIEAIRNALLPRITARGY